MDAVSLIVCCPGAGRKRNVSRETHQPGRLCGRAGDGVRRTDYGFFLLPGSLSSFTISFSEVMSSLIIFSAALGLPRILMAASRVPSLALPFLSTNETFVWSVSL